MLSLWPDLSCRSRFQFVCEVYVDLEVDGYVESDVATTVVAEVATTTTTSRYIVLGANFATQTETPFSCS